MVKKLKFFDLKEKKTFETSNYRLEEKKGRRFVVATSPSGIESWKTISKDFEMEN